jgi:DNA-binding GntR family transcriptional regulator
MQKTALSTKPNGNGKSALGFRVNREDQSLRTMTVTSLRRAIFSLHFMPGDRLTEKALCNLTGVSRSLMREALRDLEAQGLIENVPHRSPVVTTLTRLDAGEIYEVRSAIEPLAAQLFVKRATEEQVAVLKQRLAQCQLAMEDGDVLAVIEALEEFYSALFAGAGNRTAAMLARTLHTKASLLRAITFQQQSEADTRQSIGHLKKIFSAIRRRDAKAASEACLNQVHRSWCVAMKLIKDPKVSSEDPFAEVASRKTRHAGLAGIP